MIQILITNKSANNLKSNHRGSAKCSFSATYATGLFLYPLGNTWFSDVFKGYRESVGMKWVKIQLFY